MKRTSFVFITILSLAFTNTYATEIVGLSCNSSSSPNNLDDTRPRLSWKLESKEQGISQAAYRIIVASSSTLLNLNRGDMWDSGITHSNKNLYIQYRGKSLKSEQQYYWKVQVWDNNGKATWSKPAYWQMGLISASQWRAKWISASRWFVPPQYRPKGFQLKNYGGWADIDLGKSLKIDSIKLFAQDSASFPDRLKVLASDSLNFSKYDVLIDRSDRSFNLTNSKYVKLSFKPVKHRYVRLQVLPSSNTKVVTVRQMQVYSNAKNVALMKFTREYNTAWNFGHAPFLVDGMPSDNDGNNCPPDACPSVAAPQFRKEFSIQKKIKSAKIYYAVLGMADVSVNGKKITDEVLGPPFTDYSKRIMYVSYDVTLLLHKGQNAIGVLLGNGFFSTPTLGFGQRHNGNGPPRFLLQMHIIYQDGGQEWITSDRSWKWAVSQITFNDVWAGYTEDRNFYKPGWDTGKFNDHNWHPAKETEPLAGRLVARTGPPIKVTGYIAPTHVKQNHAFFKTVSAGWPLLHVNGRAHQKITVSGKGPGYEMSKLQFILAKDGPTILSPRFIIQPGPTELIVEGLTEALKPEDVSIQYIHANLKQAGDFSCSNPYLDTLFEVAKRTHQNYVYDFPADPNREKQGWTQDVQNMFTTAAYFTDVQSLYYRWWQDMADNQDEQGYLGSVIPMVNRQVYDWNSPWWSGMIIFLPWEYYLYYGDKTILSESYPHMQRYIDLLAKMAATGEGKNWNDYPYFIQNLDTSAAKSKMIIWNGAGDWNNPFTKNTHAVPTPITTMPAWYYYAQIAQRTALMLGKPKDAARYAAMSADIKKRFNYRYLNFSTGLYGDSINSQTAQVLPLATGLVPDEQKNLTYQRLLNAIHARRDHVGTGFVSTNFLLQTLANHRESALANRLINQKDYPSWSTLIKGGIFQEDWHGDGAQMPSCGGAIGTWLFQSVLGIRPDPAFPGFKKFIISPQPDAPSNLTCASGYYDSPYGRITVSWKLDRQKFTLDLEIPANTSIQLEIPSANEESFTEAGKAAALNKHITAIQSGNGLLICNVNAGKYHFETQITIY